MAAYQTVLVGTDGSDTSLRAVDRAAVVARDAGATLVLVCAYFPHTDAEIREYSDQLGSDAAHHVVGSGPAGDTLSLATDRAQAAGARDVKTVAVEGKPVDVLVHAVAEHRADLLVVGNLGLNSLTGRLLGSVPANVARHAACDVLIVHTKG